MESLETTLNCKVLCLKYSAVSCNVLQKSHDISKVTIKSPVWEHQRKLKIQKPLNEMPRMAAAHCRDYSTDSAANPGNLPTIKH